MNQFKYLNICESGFEQLLKENNYLCNADGRQWLAQRVHVVRERPLPYQVGKLIETATALGEFRPYDTFSYLDANGNKCCAEVRPTFDIPYRPNSFLVCFSGLMSAPFSAMDIIRHYAAKYKELIPFLAIGKGGNKGLFEKLYNRTEGIIKGSEAEAYLNIMERMAPRSYVRRYEQTFNDMDTAGNLRELHRFAKEQGLKEVTFVLCTGQPWYEKRLLAEWMFLLGQSEFSDIKINLILAHSSAWLNGYTPDSSPSEILLGYIAASIGPLSKDTITLYGETESKHPERYLMPGIAATDWSKFATIIRNYGNMGWPNYSELLYGTPHEEAVKEILLADIFARGSFTAEDYDEGILKDIALYQRHVGYFKGDDEEAFLKWCTLSARFVK